MSLVNKLNDVPWTEKDLNLSDFALFLSTMKVKRAYEIVIRTIMDQPIELKQVKVEEVILNLNRKRAIRLDAWAEAVDATQFAVEMENDATRDDLRKRSRFYQSMIDTPILKAGKKTKYKKLPPTFVVFITQDDFFGYDLAMYTFRNTCREVPELELGDGAEKIFLNMTSRNGRENLVSMLQYMKRSTLDNPDIISRDENLVELDGIVQEIKQSEEWEEIEMSIYDIAAKSFFEKGENEGLQKGMQKGLQKGMQKGLQQGVQKGLQIFVEDKLEEHTPDEVIIDKLVHRFSLSREEATEFVNRVREQESLTVSS